ncbi:putative uncharacterized protein DDB_G0282133 [Physella acuta]|uniref:putative uncharacterized protein DDB_G0282133 n=1 Tax=Physella acuta TaxID=109671 RepID=UPI0027DD4E96|nr:putative uncharacterized protein DDB_G0282133 [Physella acuta]XP_059145118.1 putative uncharacterized protein DDB_G0282133 [Physella acuta]
MYPQGCPMFYQVPQPGAICYVPAPVPICLRPQQPSPLLHMPILVPVPQDFSVPPPGLVQPQPQFVPCIQPLAPPPDALHVSTHKLKPTAAPFIPKSHARSATVSINPPQETGNQSASANASDVNNTDSSAPISINPLLEIDLDENPHQISDFQNEGSHTPQQHPPLLPTPQQHHLEKAGSSVQHLHHLATTNVSSQNEEFRKSSNYTDQRDVVHNQPDSNSYPSKSFSPSAHNTRWNQNGRDYSDTGKFREYEANYRERRYQDEWNNHRFPRPRGYFHRDFEYNRYSPRFPPHYKPVQQEFYNRKYKYLYEHYYDDEYEDYEEDEFENNEHGGHSRVFFNHDDNGNHGDAGYHRRSRGRGNGRGARGKNSGQQENHSPAPQHERPVSKRYSQSRKGGDNPVNKPQEVTNVDTTEQFSKGGNSTKQTTGPFDANDNFSRKKAAHNNTTTNNNNTFSNKVQNNLAPDTNDVNQIDDTENLTDDTHLFLLPSPTPPRPNTNNPRQHRNHNPHTNNGKKRYDQNRKDNNHHDRGSNDSFVKDSRTRGSNPRAAWRGSPNRSNVAQRPRPVLDEAALERQANNKRNARKELVILDEYNSDVNLKIQANGYGATTSGGSDQSGFKLLWADIKATHGVLQGKVFFEVKIMDAVSGTAEESSAVARVGWSPEIFSFRNSKGCWSLGYTEMSERSYEEIYENEDVLGAKLDLDSTPPVLSFIKNGEDFGEIISLKDHDKNLAMFPHISLKNCKVRVNFGQRDPWFPLPEGFEFIGKFPIADLVPGQVPPEINRDCEVIMLIGLPGCGKTTWAVTQQQEHPEKRYCILGTDLIIEKMDTGSGQSDDYMRRFKKLNKLADGCYSRLLKEAGMSRRNYIIDEPNVCPSIREKKLKGFTGFTRRAVIIQPSDLELQRRAEERRKNLKKIVPESNVRELKANFRLPEDDSKLFDSVEYVELQEDDARELVEKYNTRNMHYNRLDMD